MDKIFKAYDIRGVYPEEINEEITEQIGNAFVKHTSARNILIGEDGRKSTPALKKALIRGITEAGANIFLAGECTTPMFYFGVASSKTIDAGIMITASHNPAQYNGLKMVRSDATPIGQGSGMEEIKRLALQKKPIEAKVKGESKNIEIKERYIERVFSLVDLGEIKGLKIAIDTGNGMEGVIMPELLARLPQITAEKIFFEIDMSFPNHEANPLKEDTLKTLKDKVKETESHIGIAYDGDADRVGFVDEGGKMVRSDIIFAVILPMLFEKYPKSKILYDLRCSKILQEEAERLGGNSQMTRVGHAFIKAQIKKTDAAAAAELSSHFYFKEFFGVECADLMLLYLLLLISQKNKPLSKIIQPLQKYFHSGEINFEIEDKDAKIKLLKENYKKEAKNITEIDGLRMDFKEVSGWWWFSIRASNTEPLLRLNLEASNKGLMEIKKKEISKIIEK